MSRKLFNPMPPPGKLRTAAAKLSADAQAQERAMFTAFLAYFTKAYTEDMDSAERLAALRAARQWAVTSFLEADVQEKAAKVAMQAREHSPWHYARIHMVDPRIRGWKIEWGKL